MGRPLSSAPTEAEFAILQWLWKRGTATVRDIQDDLVQQRKIAYTSIATIVRILVEKGMVEIVDARRPQRFRAVIDEASARKQITDAWLGRQFGDSIADLLASVLKGRKLSAADVKELKAIVDGAAKGAKPAAKTR